MGRFMMGYSSNGGSSSPVIFILPQKFGSCLYVDGRRLSAVGARSTQIQRRGIVSLFSLFFLFFLEKLNMVVARFTLRCLNVTAETALVFRPSTSDRQNVFVEIRCLLLISNVNNTWNFLRKN